MKLRKYAFTLMEVMVSFVILSIVLSVIFSSLCRETLLKKKLEQMEKEVMERVELQQTLDRLFANLSFPEDQGDKPPLYSMKGSHPILVLTFDNGVEPNPLFCGVLKGLLLVEKRALILKLHPGKDFERIQVLKNNIDSLLFEFLTWEHIGVKTTMEWDRQASFSPSFVKMTLNEKEAYVFWVNHNQEQAIPLRGGT